MPTRTTRECDGLVLPPMLVPTTARTGKTAYSVDEPFQTQTCRRETALVLPPRGEFITRPPRWRIQAIRIPTPGPTAGDVLRTRWAPGPDLRPSETFLLSYYRNGTLHPTTEPVGTLTTRDRYAVISTTNLPKVEDCTFRMLDPQNRPAWPSTPTTKSEAPNANDPWATATPSPHPPPKSSAPPSSKPSPGKTCPADLASFLVGAGIPSGGQRRDSSAQTEGQQ
jgi:hypothetical protein